MGVSAIEETVDFGFEELSVESFFVGRGGRRDGFGDVFGFEFVFGGDVVGEVFVGIRDDAVKGSATAAKSGRLDVGLVFFDDFFGSVEVKFEGIGEIFFAAFATTAGDGNDDHEKNQNSNYANSANNEEFVG